MMQAHDDSQDASRRAFPEGSPQLVDAHCHLDFDVFDADRPDVLARASAVGVGRFVIAGYTPRSYRKARTLRTTDIRVCAGLHPWALAELDDAELDEALAELDSIAGDADAIGEIGIDAAIARRGSVPLDRQLRVARAGLEVARRHGRPLVLHVVGAHEEMLTLCREASDLPGGMVHGFSGSKEIAARFVRAGFHLSFGGASTFERNPRIREAMRSIPLDRLLVESDAPDQPPEGVEGRNEPSSVRLVLDTVARLRALPLEVVARATSENAARLFFRS